MSVTPLEKQLLDSCTNDFSTVKELIELGVDPNCRDPHGECPLHWAVRYGRTDITRFLVEKGANVNAQNMQGESALWLACWIGKTMMVKLLLALNADTEVADKRGWSPIMAAIRMGRDDIVQLLVEGGANIQVAAGDGRTPLFEAAAGGQIKIWWYLTQKLTEDFESSLPPIPTLSPKYLDPNLPVHYKNKTQVLKSDESRRQVGVEGTQSTVGDVLNSHGIALETFLAQGHFGRVWMALYNKQPVAIKILFQDSTKRMIQEISHMGAVRHEGIIVHKLFIPEINAIVMELAEGGNLNDFLKSLTKPLPWVLRLKWMIQLTEVINFIHGKGVIHRDIRCANILLSKDLDIKVSDFGIAMWLEDKDKGLELPFYASDVKAVYTISQKQDTLDFQFDIRLLAIVLSKLLLHGNDVEAKDLLDFENTCITKELPCDLPAYRKLIDFCFSRDSIAPLVLTLATSIVAQSSVRPDGVKSKVLFEMKHPEPVSLNYVATIATSSTLAARAIQMRSAIRRLAAVSPDDLIALFEKFANEKNISKNLQASKESPQETPNETNKVDVEELISQLSSDNWRKRRDAIIELGAAGTKEDRVIKILKEMLHEERAEEVRVWAAIILGRFGEPQVKHTLIQLFSFCTTNDADLVRREAARSLHVLVENEATFLADGTIAQDQV